MGGTQQIFLCYASEDKARVEEIYQRLRQRGFQPWMDKRNLVPGQRWRMEIPKALKNSDFILIFFSQHSVRKKGYVQREFKLALDTLQEIPEEMIHTIPIRLDGCAIPEQFEFLHWCDLFEEDGFEQLVQAIEVGLSQRGQPKPSPLQEEPARSVSINATDAPVSPKQTITKPPPKKPETQKREPWLDRLFGEDQFVQIPAGEFMMGSEKGDTRERPVHRVRISRDFEMGKYPVTQAQWEAVMGSNPSYFKGAERPVEQVSWDEAREFIKKLNEKDGEYDYRLPTEAEWEYACRAGSTTSYSFGDDVNELGEYAWYRDNAGEETHVVGQKQPNAWGLCDMHGNVWEWVQDKYYPDYEGAPANGSAWVENSDPYRRLFPDFHRVFRGGGWHDAAQYCRSGLRNNHSPSHRHHGLGFRLVRTAQ